jgi:hypothetical protein
LNQVIDKRKEIIVERVTLSKSVQSSRYNKHKAKEINNPTPRRMEVFVASIIYNFENC